jgi:hypothetical protein
MESIVKAGLRMGRMVWAEKYDLPKHLKDHKIVWNANIIVEGQKVWYGDIDLTQDTETLQTVANEIGKPLYVLREMDARFNTEEEPLIEKAVSVIEPK